MNETKLSNLYRISVHTETNPINGIENHFTATSDDDAIKQAETYLGSLDRSFMTTILYVSLFRVDYGRYEPTRTFLPAKQFIGQWKHDFRRVS